MSEMEQAASGATVEGGLGSAPPRAIWVFVGAVVIECFIRAMEIVQAAGSGDWRPAVVIMAVAALFSWTALRGIGWAAWLYVLASLLVWIAADGAAMRLARDGSIVCSATLRLPLVTAAAVALLVPQVRAWLHASAAHRAAALHRAMPSIF